MADKPNGMNDRKADLDDKSGLLSDDNKPQAAEDNPPRKQDVDPNLGDTSGLNVPDNKGGVKDAPSY